MDMINKTLNKIKKLQVCQKVRIQAKEGNEEIDINLLKEKDLIKVNTNRVKVFKDTDSCSKLILKGINVSASVRDLIEGSGGKVEE